MHIIGPWYEEDWSGKVVQWIFFDFSIAVIFWILPFLPTKQALPILPSLSVSRSTMTSSITIQHWGKLKDTETLHPNDSASSSMISTCFFWKLQKKKSKHCGVLEHQKYDIYALMRDVKVEDKKEHLVGCVGEKWSLGKLWGKLN